LDKFPEAFERAEQNVPFSDAKGDWNKFKAMARSYFGSKWKDTEKQNEALYREFLRYDWKAPTPKKELEEALRYLEKRAPSEKQPIEARFSRAYATFDLWLEKATRTTAYQQRIISYVRLHPDSSLAEARGHSKKKR